MCSKLLDASKFLPMMARTADNGSLRVSDMVPPLPQKDVGTYGRRREVHRHRQNRPCTYQSYRRVSCEAPSVLLEWLGGIRARMKPGNVSAVAPSWHIVVAAHLPIVNDESSDLFCEARQRMSRQHSNGGPDGGATRAFETGWWHEAG